MDPPPEEGNFCDDSKWAMQPQIMARYNRHVGYVDISDQMVNSYLMCRCTFKWTTKLFFHLLDLTVLNIWILLSSCGAKFQTTTGEEFDWGSLKKLLSPHPSMLGRPSAAAANVMRLDSRHNQHWPAKHKNNIRCRVCSERGQQKTTIYKCAKCDVGLCVVPCFADYHTKTNL